MGTTDQDQRLHRIRATLHSITTHLVQRQLPPPVAIALPSHGNPHIEIRIHDFQVGAWIASGAHLDPKAMQVRPARTDGHGPYLTVTQTARLEDGATFRLQWAELWRAPDLQEQEEPR
jgi:hypothetical protein